MMKKTFLLKPMLLLFAMIAGVGSVWGQDVTWEKVAPADLVTGDVVVIVDQTSGKAMSHSSLNSKGAPNAEDVTLSEDKATVTFTATGLDWEVTVSGSGDAKTFKFGVADTEDYLYSTADNNGLRIGDGSTNVCGIENNGTADFITITDTKSAKRYIGVYSNTDWRSYTSINSNIRDCVTAFYKKVESGVASPSVLADPVTLAYDATKGTISYMINNAVDDGELTAELTEGDWLTLGTVGEETIPFTTTANPTGADRTATVTLTYTYDTDKTKTAEVTITQEANPNVIATIAEVRALGEGNVKTKGIVTSCVGTTAYIQDATAAICVYGAELTVGDEIVVEGTLKTYNGLMEIAGTLTFTVVSSDNTVEPEVMTIADINQSDKQGWLVKIENATVESISNQNTTIAQGENTIVVRGIDESIEYAVDDVLTLTGNIGCYNVAQIANPTDVTVKTLEDAGLAYSDEEFEAKLGEDNTFPTLTNPNELAVSYQSSNEDVATVDVEGNVTLVGKGTTTITATSKATDTYKAGVASYVLTVVVPSTPVNGYYQKVTSTADITDGQYLIVYEGDDAHESVAFDGGLESFDKVGNSIDIEFAQDGTIVATAETQAAEFTIDVTAGTLKGASGKYPGVSSYSNGLNQSDKADAYVHSFSIDDFENADIQIETTGGTMSLRYNYANNQLRFRYYKSGQQAIQLYKYVNTNPTSVTVTAKKEYTTFCSTYDLDFSQVEGLEAYVVPSVSNTAAVINKVNKVPAGTGLILKKTVSETEFTVPVATETDNIGTNLMVGVTVATDMTGVANAYILSDGSFYACSGGTLAAGKAYLVAADWAESTAPSFSIVEGGEATGIKSLTPALSQGEEVYYDLSGRRVAQPTNGVYIVNGKKVLVP